MREKKEKKMCAPVLLLRANLEEGQQTRPFEGARLSWAWGAAANEGNGATRPSASAFLRCLLYALHGSRGLFGGHPPEEAYPSLTTVVQQPVTHIQQAPQNAAIKAD